jgi:signal transduction histidine kinase
VIRARPGAADTTTQDAGWHRFSEASRAPVAALASFFAAAETGLKADALLVKVWGRSCGEARLAVAHGVERNRALAISSAVREIDEQVLESRVGVELTREASRSVTCEDVWQAGGMARLLALPMIFGREIFGILYVFDEGSHAFSQRTRMLASSLAQEAARAVASVRIEYAEVRRLVDRDVGHALGDIADGGGDVHELAMSLVEGLCELSGAARGGVMLLEDGDWLQLLAGGFGATPEAAASYRVQVDDEGSCAARVFRSGQPDVSNNAVLDPRLSKGYVELFGISRLVTVPLGAPYRRPWGVVHLADKASPFDADDIHRVVVASSHLAHSFDLARATVDLRKAQITDQVLTELAIAIAAGHPLVSSLSETLDRVRRNSSIDRLVLRAQPSLEVTATSETEIGPSLLARFHAAVNEGPEGLHVEHPAAPGDPGCAWRVFAVGLHGEQVGRLGALRAQGSDFGRTDREGLDRLVKVAGLGLQAESHRKQHFELARLGERQRIADDLHDHLAQLLFMATANVEAALDACPTSSAPLEQAYRQLVHGQRSIRETLSALTRPAGMSASQRLNEVIEHARADYGLRVSGTVPGDERGLSALEPAAVETLVRVASESLANVRKHAGDCTVSVRLATTPSQIRLTVSDDGCGFNAEHQAEGYGLSSLRRSVAGLDGHFSVTGRPDGGTVVRCVLPVPMPAEAEDIADARSTSVLAGP